MATQENSLQPEIGRALKQIAEAAIARLDRDGHRVPVSSELGAIGTIGLAVDLVPPQGSPQGSVITLKQARCGHQGGKISINFAAPHQALGKEPLLTRKISIDPAIINLHDRRASAESPIPGILLEAPNETSASMVEAIRTWNVR